MGAYFNSHTGMFFGSFLLRASCYTCRAPPPHQPLRAAAEASNAHGLLNAERARKGLAPVSRSTKLKAAAAGTCQ